MSEQTTTPASNIGGDLGIPTPVVVTLPTTEVAPIATPAGDTTSNIPTPNNTPTPDDTGDLGIGMEDFASVLSGAGHKEAAPKITATPKDKQQEAITKTKETPTTIARDYSQFTPEEATFLKQMSNPAFAFVTSKFTELKKRAEDVGKLQAKVATLEATKTILPETLYDHPQGFVVTPEYNSAVERLNFVQQAQEYWRNQLDRQRRGEDVYPGVMSKDGTIVEDRTQPLKATGYTEGMLMGRINEASQELYKAQQEINNIQGNWQAKHDTGVKAINEANTKYFSFADDPKNGLIEIKNDLKKQFPVQFHKNPLLPMLLNSLAANIGFQNQARKAAADIAKEKEEKERSSKATRNAGPTEGSIGNGIASSGGASNVSEPTFDDFQRALRGE